MYEICRVLKISRSAYTYWQTKGKEKEKEMIAFLHAVIEIYVSSNGIYGAPKIKEVLCSHGTQCSVSKVSRAIKTLGIRSIVAEKFKSKPSTMKSEEKKKIVNLIKDLPVNHINQVWTTDISYIKTKYQDTYYLITYIDLYSRKVVAWDLRVSQKSKDMIEVLKKAINERKPKAGLIIHSDKGSQMRSGEYRNFLEQNNMIASYTSLNHSCDENAVHESFHAQLKKEELYQHKPNTFVEAYVAIKNYIEKFYNVSRIHSAIGYRSPVNFELSL